MINLIFKKKEIVFDCFCHYIAQQNPIQKAHYFYPEWWKKLEYTATIPNDYGVEINRPTMKTCTGFIDLFKTGFIIPLWADLNIKVGEGGFAYEFANNESNIIKHPEFQFANKFTDHTHFKINSPWVIKEKNNTKVLLTGNSWYQLEHCPRIKIMQGVVDFTYQTQTSINGFFEQSPSPYQYNLQAGMPILHLIPLTDKPYKLNIIPLDSVQFNKEAIYSNKFNNWGMNNKRKKCPLNLID